MISTNISEKSKNWLLNFSLIFSSTIPQFGMNIVAPALPQLGNYFHSEVTSLQFVITLYLIGYAFAVLFSGVLSERFGARQVHIWGITVFSLSSFACTQVTSFYLLLALRFIQALCGCGITVLSRLIIQQVYPAQKHIGIITTLALVVALSPGVAPVLGGLILDIYDWKQIFWFLGGMGGISLLLFCYFVPSIQKYPNNISTISSFFNEVFHGVKQQAFRRYLVAISLVSMGQIAFLANSAYPIQINMGISASEYGFLLALTAIGFVIGTQIARIIVPQYGTQAVLLCAGIVSLLGGTAIISASYLWPNSPWSLVAPMLIIMLSVGIVVPATQAGLLRIPSAKPGYLASVFFFGQIALSTIYGMGTKSFNTDSLTLSIAVAAPCLLLGGLSLFWNCSWESSSEA